MRRAAGYSLIETAVALGVVGILASMALPAFRDFMAKERLVTRANETIALVNAARAHAVLARVPTVACPSIDGATCHADPDWTRGHIVFEDRNGDRALDAGEPLLRSRIHGATDVAVQSSRALVAFRTSGRADGNNLSIRLCAGPSARSTDAGIRGRAVVVNNAGRARMARITDCPP